MGRPHGDHESVKEDENENPSFQTDRIKHEAGNKGNNANPFLKPVPLPGRNQEPHRGRGATCFHSSLRLPLQTSLAHAASLTL